MGLTDIIAQFILSGLERSEGALELSRGSLAEQFGCVPSQINYVLTTRFSPEHGYIIDTKRGGGGYIRITRVRLSPEPLIMHTVNAIGDQLDAPTASALLENLRDALGAPLPAVIGAACSDNALRSLEQPARDRIRASVMKHCLLRILE
ncbi:MAG: CtsR family transcriptional regulator [Oscillospiraceae bacterium]|jgi:transcriptional regulator CtsR|nr:CtsR family transcriptional regulator [Oscillospiraceae bacterium]